MRRHLSEPRFALAGALALSLALTRSGRAQSGVAEEGALFALVPIGARAVGMGQAVVAAQPGSEAVWYNPSALAVSLKREAAIHHAQTVFGTGDAISIVVPSSLLGVLALSANVQSYGALPVTPPEGSNEDLGKVIPASYTFAATYATEIGAYVNAGLTYKLLQFRIDCTGPCPSVSELNASTSALDLGAQFTLKKKLPLRIGVSLRNVGVRLQVNDNPQSDPLPTRLQLGAQYWFVPPERIARDTELRFAVDLLDEVRIGSPSAHLGADVVWQKRAHLRGGYVFDRSEGGGPSIGLGLVTGNLSFDIARLFSGLSADAGQSPTYLSLRYLF